MASRPIITAWPVPFCSVCSMKPMPERAADWRTSSAWWPTTTKMRSGGASDERGIDDVLEQRLSAGAVQHFGVAALHAGAESGGEDHDGYGLVHYFYYAFLRRRPSCASLTTTAAVAAGSWRTLSVWLERLPAIDLEAQS